MSPQIVPVKNNEQIEQLAQLASDIWHEYFITILSAAQIDYMIEHFQSVQAITSQIQDGYRYFFLEVDNCNVGYTGVHPENGKLFLSKIYIRRSDRGKKYASLLFDYLVSLCRQEHLNAIWLTVNRNNEHSIAVYHTKGFKTIRPLVTDIGAGFIMDDYVMEMPVHF